MSDSRNGSLFVVGGAEDRENSRRILHSFVQTSGGDQARIAVVATASTIPEELLEEYSSAFTALGVKDLELVYHEHRVDAENPKGLEVLKNATGVYFTGGDQLKLVTLLGGTAWARVLHEQYHQGTHIGGTSAGASAMSTVMIARGTSSRTPRLSSVRLSPGLGILHRVIVDQHFQERHRLNRLIAAVLRNPYMLGFGIDENTAFIVDPSGNVNIVGNGTLTVVDASDLIHSNIPEIRESDPIAFAGVKLHILAEGWGINIRDQRVVLPKHNNPSSQAPDSPVN